MQMVQAFHALTDNEPRFSESQGDRLLIGLSGGKDSLSMLHSLVRHKPTTPMHEHGYSALFHANVLHFALS